MTPRDTTTGAVPELRFYRLYLKVDMIIEHS